MSELGVRIGKNIRIYRRANRMTLSELAERINKSKATVGKYEQGAIALCGHLFAIASAKAKATERDGTLRETGINLVSNFEANQFARQALVHITISSHD
jgi:transcriptional regulator with XRE-family HTH domain